MSLKHPRGFVASWYPIRRGLAARGTFQIGTKLYFSTWLLRRSFTCASGVGEIIEYHVYVHLFFNARAHNVAREVCMSACLGQQTPTGVIALERQVENKKQQTDWRHWHHFKKTWDCLREPGSLQTPRSGPFEDT